MWLDAYVSWGVLSLFLPCLLQTKDAHSKAGDYTQAAKDKAGDLTGSAKDAAGTAQDKASSAANQAGSKVCCYYIHLSCA